MHDDPVRVALVNQAFVPPGMKIGETGAHLPALGLLMLGSAIEERDPQMKGKIEYFDEEHLGEEDVTMPSSNSFPTRKRES